MPIDPSIALQVRPVEVPNQLGQLAQASQIMAAQRQGEVAQMQLEQLQQERQDMLAFQKKLQESGQNPDLRSFAAMLIKSPKHVEKGIELLQKLDEQDKYAEYLKKFSPGAAAAPAAAPAPAVSGALGSGTFGITPAPTNALAAAPAAAPTAAPVNQLADLESRYRTVAAINTPGAKAEAELLKSQIVEARKPHTVGGRLVGSTGNVIYEAPPETSDIKEYEYAKKNQGYKGTFTDFMQLKPAAGAARQVMAVNTQLPASEEAQKEFMKEMRQTYGALKQAPTVLQNIEEAKKLVPQAKGFMGAGGDTMLQAASFLNNRLGTNIDTKGVQSAEELRSRLFLGIMDNLKKLDSQPSQQQQAALQQALGSIGTDPRALPRVLDVFGDSIRQKVDLYNEEAASAEGRGVKFPYKPTITLPPKPTAEAAAAAAPAIPAAAVQYLQANPNMKAAFDAKYGAGAADRALKGQ